MCFWPCAARTAHCCYWPLARLACLRRTSVAASSHRGRRLRNNQLLEKPKGSAINDATPAARGGVSRGSQNASRRRDAATRRFITDGERCPACRNPSRCLRAPSSSSRFVFLFGCGQRLLCAISRLRVPYSSPHLCSSVPPSVAHFFRTHTAGRAWCGHRGSHPRNRNPPGGHHQLRRELVTQASHPLRPCANGRGFFIGTDKRPRSLRESLSSVYDRV